LEYLPRVWRAESLREELSGRSLELAGDLYKYLSRRSL
jgi:hypothetical protein